jgi:hypothetical protein
MKYPRARPKINFRHPTTASRLTTNHPPLTMSPPMRNPLPLCFLCLLLLPRSAAAQQPPATSPSSAQSPLSAFLLTMGPGDMIYERFGHNAIIIEDRNTGQSHAFNYGIFAFDDGFVFRFLKGRMMYWMEAADARDTIRFYTGVENRSVWLQELNLTATQKESLRNHLVWNTRDENKYYPYNYYNNNCSTKVRDALDLAVGGAIAAQLKDKPTGRTYRWHTRRIVASDPAIYTALSFVLGPNVDPEISQWEESFLPEELMAYLRNVTIPDDAGNPVPIIAREQKLATSTAFFNRESPPRGWIIAYLLIGLFIGAAFVFLARRSDRPWPRRGFLAAAVLWTLLVGGAGAFLTWGFTTEHWSVYWNENWLQFNPLTLALVVLIPLTLRNKRWARKPMLVIAALVFAGALVGFLIQILPGVNQQNGEMISLALPAHAGLACAAYLLFRRVPLAATTNRTDGPSKPVVPIKKKHE